MSPVLPPNPDFGAAVCAALREQVERLGLSIGDEPHWSAATFEVAVDPYSQEASTVAYWRGGARFGKATFSRMDGFLPSIRCCSRIRNSRGSMLTTCRSGGARSACGRSFGSICRGTCSRGARSCSRCWR